ncbi:hypothetical protein BDV24DRAFT_132579 [Aspergillus arachidicola]|uniref:Uncharacterized protein n=1 Tax=Aspergillus arachidicola TaxID=656916 RepID=A0A5N6Y8R3_9EURO|nr:hypothetical protein BDV24DRAFT_132579 [Aspergillus arachidicola]
MMGRGTSIPLTFEGLLPNPASHRAWLMLQICLGQTEQIRLLRTYMPEVSPL